MKTPPELEEARRKLQINLDNFMETLREIETLEYYHTDQDYQLLRNEYIDLNERYKERQEKYDELARLYEMVSDERNELVSQLNDAYNIRNLYRSLLASYSEAFDIACDNLRELTDVFPGSLDAAWFNRAMRNVSYFKHQLQEYGEEL